MSPSGCFTPLPSMPIAATSTRSPVMWMPSICTTSRSSFGQVRGHPLLHARSRERDEVARGRRLRYAAPRRRRNVALRQSHRTPKLPRRHVDQHQVHRPLAEPVLRRPPAPSSAAAVPCPSSPRTRGRSIATLPAWKPILPARSAPAMTAPVLAARMARPTGHLGVRFHHRAQRLDPGRQAEPIEGRKHFLPRLTHRRARHCSRHHDRCSSWRCFPFVESAPRAYRLKASNAAPFHFRSSSSLSDSPDIDAVRLFSPLLRPQ